MRYGKIVNGNLELAPNPLIIDGKHVFTSDPDIFAWEGYLPIEYTPVPDYPEGYEATYKWAEKDRRIIRIWEIQPASEVFE